MTIAVLAAIAIVLAAGAGYWWYRERQEDEAGRALARAHAALRGEQAGDQGNPEEAMRRYREVAEKRGTRSAEEALVRLGNLQYDAGKVDEAVASFGEYLAAYPRGRFLLAASLGKSYALETKGDLQEAAKTLSETLDREKEDPLVGEVYISLARLYEGLKKPDEAMRVYGQVVERFEQTQWAQYALKRMGSLKTK